MTYIKRYTYNVVSAIGNAATSNLNPCHSFILSDGLDLGFFYILEMQLKCKIMLYAGPSILRQFIWPCAACSSIFPMLLSIRYLCSAKILYDFTHISSL